MGKLNNFRNRCDITRQGLIQHNFNDGLDLRKRSNAPAGACLDRLIESIVEDRRNIFYPFF